MNKKFKDIIIVGFALFAIFFGAGNLIFPPYLGVLAGTE
ncbi:MAG: branched-chain amino acid transport system II carrier protein, partial [Finegoldia magna]|nr:branched-chain amino acid transport system II carrier protein [Finegoldia magna]